MQAGYSLVTLLDPQTQADTPVMGTLNQIIALVIFLQLNVHHWLLRGLAASFSYRAAGSRALAPGEWARSVLQAAGGIWLAAVQIARRRLWPPCWSTSPWGSWPKHRRRFRSCFLDCRSRTALAAGSDGGPPLWPGFFEHASPPHVTERTTSPFGTVRKRGR